MKTTPEQAFKIGFLLKCAEEGLTQEETSLRVKKAIDILKANKNIMEKQAWLPWDISKFIAQLGWSGVKDVAAPLAGHAAMIGAGTMVGAPIVAGALGGYGLAKATSGNPVATLDEVKQDEIISEYSRLADQAKRRALLKKIQNQTGKRIVPLSPSFGA